MSKSLFAALLVLTVSACGESTPGGSMPSSDARPTSSGDAAAAVTLPTWQLEDIQPTSPRTGQTYGLDVFTNRIIVVSLLEGF